MIRWVCQGGRIADRGSLQKGFWDPRRAVLQWPRLRGGLLFHRGIWGSLRLPSKALKPPGGASVGSEQGLPLRLLPRKAGRLPTIHSRGMFLGPPGRALDSLWGASHIFTRAASLDCPHQGTFLSSPRKSPFEGFSRGLAKAAGTQSTRDLKEADSAAPIFQYVGRHAKRKDRVYVWGFCYSGALGIPSFVVPDVGWKKRRRIQPTPYRLDLEEKVRERWGRWGWGWMDHFLCSEAFRKPLSEKMLLERGSWTRWVLVRGEGHISVAGHVF